MISFLLLGLFISECIYIFLTISVLSGSNFVSVLLKIDGKISCFVDTEEAGTDTTTIEKPIQDIVHNETFSNICLATGNDVFLYRIEDGEPSSAFYNLHDGEITCCALDQGQRNLLVGTIDGDIMVQYFYLIFFVFIKILVLRCHLLLLSIFFVRTFAVGWICLNSNLDFIYLSYF